MRSVCKNIRKTMDSGGDADKAPEEALHIFSLKESSIKDFVCQKLAYTLKHGCAPLTNLLMQFYGPVEKALIQASLGWNSGRRLQTAQQLGVHRNTLQSKIRFYGISLEDVMSRTGHFNSPLKEVFISSLEDTDLEAPAQRAFLLLKQKGALKEPLLENLARPVERAVAQTVLRHFNGRKIKSAKALGISVRALKSKLQQRKPCSE